MKFYFSIAALLGGIAIALGAWSSHGGAKILSPEQIALVEKGIRYQFIHVFGLFAVSWAMAQWPQVAGLVAISGALMLAGVVLFRQVPMNMAIKL